MKNILTVVLLFIYGTIFCQTVTISGFIQDSESDEKLINAVVMVKNTTNAVSTNQFGYYSLTIKKNPTDSITIYASNIGYEPKSLKIAYSNQSNVNFNLKNISKIDSILITAQIPKNNTTEVGKIEIPITQLKIMPALGGESDIFKGLQLMPGIQSGSEGQSSLYVRGGSPDENLILLDDIPLYYVSHLSGFISVFNTDALSTVEVYKAGYPARYGSRLSSVIDVRMKDGDMKKFHKILTIGIVDTKFLIEGPIIKDKLSFIFSARYLPLELLMRPFTFLSNNGYILAYNFYDVNGKINFKINNKNHLYLSLYSGDDDLKFKLSQLVSKDNEAKYKLIWGNRLAALRWNCIITDKFYVNTSLAYTRFRYINELNSFNKVSQNTIFYNFTEGIQDYMLNSTADYNFLRNYKIKFGINEIYHYYQPGNTILKQAISDSVISDTTYGLNNIKSFESRFFIENNITIGNFLSANLGLNISDYLIKNKPYWSIQPRIVLNFMLSKYFSFKAAYSEMTQYVHLLTSNNLGITPDIWVPATEKMPPSSSRQFSTGIYKSFAQNNFELSIEGYYKLSDNLICYKEGAVFNGNAENWQDKIETGGTGTFYGIELLLQKKQGRLTGWISYTYASAEHQFKNINFGKQFPFKYDRRHSVDVVVNYYLKDNISISGDWFFGSGYPYTMPVGIYDIVNEGKFNSFDMFYDQNIFIYADRNAYRMRPYHRLDLAMNFSKKIKKGIRTWSFSIYNVYNRQNPYFYFTKYDKNTGKYSLYQQSLFPVIPSVSYSLKF